MTTPPLDDRNTGGLDGLSECAEFIEHWNGDDVHISLERRVRVVLLPSGGDDVAR